MTLSEYMMGLQKLIEENPEAKDYEVIYSVDDEGNAYHKVHSNGTFVEVENTEAWSLELVWDEETESNSGNPNAIIIN